MKRLLLVFFALAFHFVVFSQEALWHTQQIKSPEVNENNSVTFRFYAPNAETVQQHFTKNKKKSFWDSWIPEL